MTMLRERQKVDRQFHVDKARENVQRLDPSLDVDRLISRLVLSSQDMARGQGTDLDVGKKLDRNLSKALVTLLFAALEGSYMVTSSDKEETTKLTVIKL